LRGHSSCGCDGGARYGHTAVMSPWL
jgi:hypothetical protein